MIQYKGFTFLDLHKTGCTHILSLLERYIVEDKLYFNKHQAVGPRFRNGDIYVVSVRDPLEQYISLYRYGLDGRGILYERLKKSGLSDLYKDSTSASFTLWLEYIFDVKSMSNLDEKYENFVDHHPYLGFFSYRLLKLAFRNISAALDGVSGKEDLVQRIRDRALPHFVIRNECLEEDFLRFLNCVSEPNVLNPVTLVKPIEEIKEEIFDLDNANVSESSPISFASEEEKEEIRKKIYAREWVYGFFGYPDLNGEFCQE